MTSRNRWVSGATIDRRQRMYRDGSNHTLGSGAQYTDGRGNQTAIGAYVFQYDAENRLKNSAIGSTSATYGYDADGQRVTKQTGSLTTIYVYDAQGELVRWRFGLDRINHGFDNQANGFVHRD